MKQHLSKRKHSGQRREVTQEQQELKKGRCGGKIGRRDNL